MALYDRLATYPATIRVLDILPGRQGARIECRLRQIQLSESHRCVSYTWGSSASQVSIRVNDQDFLVRRNLWKFLNTVRALGSPFMSNLWIDAVCINQKDIAERNLQVQQMGDIYSKASQVLIWLGEVPPGTAELFRSLRCISKDTRAPVNDSNSIIKRIAKLPHWRRTWIVQEILLAKDAIVVTDDGVIKWDQFITIDSHFSLIRRIFALSSIPCFGLIEFYKDMQKSTAIITFSKLLSNFKYTECFDIRDRVYGLAGILPSTRDIQVDYNESKATTAIRFAMEGLGENADRFQDNQNWYNYSDVRERLNTLADLLNVFTTLLCNSCFEQKEATTRNTLWPSPRYILPSGSRARQVLITASARRTESAVRAQHGKCVIFLREVDGQCALAARSQHSMWLEFQDPQTDPQTRPSLQDVVMYATVVCLTMPWYTGILLAERLLAILLCLLGIGIFLLWMLLGSLGAISSTCEVGGVKVNIF